MSESVQKLIDRMGDPLGSPADPLSYYKNPLWGPIKTLSDFSQWLGEWERADMDYVRMGLLHELGADGKYWTFEGKLTYLPAIFLLQVADGYLVSPQLSEGAVARHKLKVKASRVLVHKVFRGLIDERRWAEDLLVEDSKPKRPDLVHFFKMLFWFFRHNGQGGICNFPAKKYIKPDDRELLIMKDFLRSFAKNPFREGETKAFLPYIEDCVRILDHIGCLKDYVSIETFEKYPPSTIEIFRKVACSGFSCDLGTAPLTQALYEGRESAQLILLHGIRTGQIVLGKVASV